MNLDCLIFLPEIFLTLTLSEQKSHLKAGKHTKMAGELLASPVTSYTRTRWLAGVDLDGAPLELAVHHQAGPIGGLVSKCRSEQPG